VNQVFFGIEVVVFFDVVVEGEDGWGGGGGYCRSA